MPKPTPRLEVTLEDVAHLFAEIDARRSSRARLTLLKILAASSAGQLYRRLDDLAADAGLDRNAPGWELAAVALDRELEQLAGSDADWQDPREVLETEGPMEPEDLVHLRCLCHARLDRGEGDTERLAEVARKLRGLQRVAA